MPNRKKKERVSGSNTFCICLKPKPDFRIDHTLEAPIHESLFLSLSFRNNNNNNNNKIVTL